MVNEFIPIVEGPQRVANLTLPTGRQAQRRQVPQSHRLPITH